MAECSETKTMPTKHCLDISTFPSMENLVSRLDALASRVQCSPIDSVKLLVLFCESLRDKVILLSAKQPWLYCSSIINYADGFIHILWMFMLSDLAAWLSQQNPDFKVSSSLYILSSSVRALGSQAWWVCGNILWSASSGKGFYKSVAAAAKLL